MNETKVDKTDGERAAVNSWAEFIDRMRGEARPEWYLGLRPRGPFENGDAFLDRVERKLVASYPAPKRGEQMGPLGALLWGTLFGDVLVRDLGGHWVFPAWTGSLGEELFECAVALPWPGVSTDGAKFYPMRRVYKFASVDREDGLTCVYRFSRDIIAGKVAFADLTPGKWHKRGRDRVRTISK